MSRTDKRVRVSEQYRWEPDFNSDDPIANGRLVHTVVEEVVACTNGHRYTAATVRLRGKDRKRLVCVVCERDRSRNHKRRIAAAAQAQALLTYLGGGS